MIPDLAIFRLIEKGIASLEELERWWSLDDLMRATAYLNMMLDLSQEAEQKAVRESKRTRHST